jgi:hypothetical protein
LLVESSRLVKENQRLRGQPQGPERAPTRTPEELIDRLVLLLENWNRRMAESN